MTLGLIYERSFNWSFFFPIDFQLFIIIYICIEPLFAIMAFNANTKRERERGRVREKKANELGEIDEEGVQSVFNHRVRVWPTCSRRGEQRKSSFDSNPLSRQWNAVIIDASLCTIALLDEHYRVSFAKCYEKFSGERLYKLVHLKSRGIRVPDLNLTSPTRIELRRACLI